jgi:hypothetical protein
MLTKEKVTKFVREWIEAWNRHDLDQIMTHYAEKIRLSSPFIVKLLGNPKGEIEGKEALRSYFVKGLAAFPDLKFELIHFFIGVNSVVLYYRSVKNMLSCEVMELDDKGRISRVMAHYNESV